MAPLRSGSKVKCWSANYIRAETEGRRLGRVARPSGETLNRELRESPSISEASSRFRDSRRSKAELIHLGVLPGALSTAQG